MAKQKPQIKESKMTTEQENQIKALEAQIKALKKEARAASPKTPKPKVTMMTASKRQAKEEALAQEYLKKIRRLAGSPLGLATPSEVVDAYIGGLSDLPPLD
jgi:transcription initiation factor TFIID subunit TAF12